MNPGYVPTDVVGPIVAELVRERWPHGDGIDVLAEKVGCSYDAIDGIIRQQNKSCEFGLADALLCALGRPDLWRGPLADIYLGLSFATDRSVRMVPKGHQRCARDGCSTTFPTVRKRGYSRRVYCSDRCTQIASRVRVGKQRRASQGRRFVCRNGHERTPESVEILKNGTRRCRICQRERTRECRARKRAQTA